MSRRKGIVLIVDDEEEIRESIEMLLNSEGLFTDTAADGEEGLKKIEENLYDAVLLDLMLPGRSGMEVQKDIRRIDPTLPVRSEEHTSELQSRLHLVCRLLLE